MALVSGLVGKVTGGDAQSQPMKPGLGMGSPKQDMGAVAGAQADQGSKQFTIPQNYSGASSPSATPPNFYTSPFQIGGRAPGMYAQR